MQHKDDLIRWYLDSKFAEDLKTIINLIVSSKLFYTFHLQATTNLYIILHFLT